MHPDDEIFTFPFINSEGALLTFLYNSFEKKRPRLNRRFTNLLILLIHQDYRHLNYILQKIFADYEIIFSPLIEGGHQDHDTIGFCALKNSDNFKNKKIYFYPTYTSYGNLGLFSVMNSNNYGKTIFKELKKKFKHRPLKTFYYIFFVYKSQYLSWLLVSFPYILNLLKNKPSKLYVLKESKMSNLEIFEQLKGIPLLRDTKDVNKVTEKIL